MSFNTSQLNPPFSGKFALRATLSNNYDELVVKDVNFYVKIYEFSCFENKLQTYEVG